MKTRNKILIATIILVVAAAALLAQGPAAGRFTPGQGPLAQLMGENPDVGSHFGAPYVGAFGPMGGRHGRFGSRVMKHMLAEYLELTDAQKAVLEEARESARPEAGEAMKALMENRRAIREAIRNGQPVDTLADEQGGLVADMIKKGAVAASDIKAQLNLTPEQVEKLDALRSKLHGRAEAFHNMFQSEQP